MGRGNAAVEDAHLTICGALSDMGCIYDISIDNRGGSRSRYIFVRKPVQLKIRVSDHGSDRIDKEKVRSKVEIIDVRTDGRGMTAEDSIARICEVLNKGQGAET